MFTLSKYIFSDNQDLAQAVGSYASTNVLDLGSAGFGDSIKNPVYLDVLVTEAFDSATDSATLIIILEHSDSATSGFATKIRTLTLTIADLTLGARPLQVALPVDLKRYVRLKYSIDGEAMTAGKISACLDLGVTNI